MSFSLAFTLGPWLGTLVYDNLGSKEVWYAAFFVSALSAAALLMIPAKPSNVREYQASAE